MGKRMMPWKQILQVFFCVGALFAQNNLPEKNTLPVLPSILHITSAPSGAKVYINNSFVGMTPFQEEMKIGSYKVSVKKELYSEDSAEIVVAAAEIKAHAFTLQPKFGIIEVITAPEPGANVYLNNILVGHTPYISQQLPEGEYTVRFTKHLYKTHEENFFLTAGKTDRRVVPLENNSGKVTVHSVFSTIFIDGINVGNDTHTAILDTGKHTIIADRSEQYFPAELEITLAANDIRSFELEPQPRLGGVSVIVETENATDAEVFVNDTLKGKAPTIFSMIIGTHSIAVKKNLFRDERKYFTVSENTNTTVKFQMMTLEEERLQNMSKWNSSKWISAGIDILAIGASIYFNQKASNSYSAYSSARTTADAAKLREQTNQHSRYFSISAGFVVTASAATIFSWIKELTQ
ncbi:MAG TPA: hypothetical protein DCQ28_02060 [Bacteroidetes bacterium]|nr:hypothetical protein [Bacteroidota bacterium]